MNRAIAEQKGISMEELTSGILSVDGKTPEEVAIIGPPNSGPENVISTGPGALQETSGGLSAAGFFMIIIVISILVYIARKLFGG